jgi:hypothetical protein
MYFADSVMFFVRTVQDISRLLAHLDLAQGQQRKVLHGDFLHSRVKILPVSTLCLTFASTISLNFRELGFGMRLAATKRSKWVQTRR